MTILGWCSVDSDKKSLAFGKYCNVRLDFYVNGSKINQTIVDAQILCHESESSIQIIMTYQESPYILREHLSFPIAIFMRIPMDRVFYRFDAVLPFEDELSSYYEQLPHILLY